MPLKFIAKELNLSVSTVSRALQNSQNGISTKTKKRVREFAQSIDFIPNINASNLRKRTSNLIGVIVPTISNNFYESFLAALENKARENGHTLMILQSNNDLSIEKENVKILNQNNIAYLFVCLAVDDKDLTHFDKLIKQAIPVIFFDKIPFSNDYKKISISDKKATELACQELIRKNPKSILGIFGNLDYSISKIRVESFNNYLKINAPKIQFFNEIALNSEQAFQSMEKYFGKIDSVFCMTDEILIGVMKFIQINKIKYPTDIKIIALSNGFIPNLYFPSISYIETSGYKLGEKSFSLVQSDEKSVTIEPIFVAGNSL